MKSETNSKCYEENAKFRSKSLSRDCMINSIPIQTSAKPFLISSAVVENESHTKSTDIRLSHFNMFDNIHDEI